MLTNGLLHAIASIVAYSLHWIFPYEYPVQNTILESLVEGEEIAGGSEQSGSESGSLPVDSVIISEPKSVSEKHVREA